MDGALMEVGPYRVNEDGTLRIQEGGWDEFANVLFIDNPVGTGFSYVDGDSLIHDLGEMADQVVVFLEKWFAIFPKFEGLDVSRSQSHESIGYIASRTRTDHQCRYISQASLTQANTSPTSLPQYWTVTKPSHSTRCGTCKA